MARSVLISILTLLVAIATGCSSTHRYDSRLVEADSLMNTHPDSALALVEALPASDLSTDHDRAYRDLLLTQAHYKCYITATSDSDINRALTYYRQHKNDREKLTRAYIYKGAVMEELGHPDSAMHYYKTAEATATPKDYANLGYATLRMADLYRMYYADAEICFDKFQSALHYFRLTGNKRLQQNCLFNMGGISAITMNQHPEQYLSEATQLALELNDSLAYFNCRELKCRQLLQDDTTLEQAKQIAMDCLNNYGQYLNNDILLDIAEIYAKTGKIDSARFFMNHVNENISNIDIGQIRTRKYLILSTMALEVGNTTLSNHYDKQAHQIEDSIHDNINKYRFQQVENTNNKQQINDLKRFILEQGWIVTGLIVASLAVAVLLLITLKQYRKNRLINAIVSEMEQARNEALMTSSESAVNIDRHEELLEQIEEKDSVIETFVKNMVNFMQTSIDASEHDTPKRIRERITDSISHIIADEEFWTSLRAFLDRNHNNIISRIAENPKIKTKDLKFIELLCCGFNYLEIAITMGYTPKYISQKKDVIAKKLNLDIPLQEYLNLALTAPKNA